MNARMVSRVGLVLLAVPGLVNAVWILAAPRSFYDDFPGFGNPWVSPDGPYNEHLLRDFGAFQLGLVVLAVCALVWMTRPLVTATALAWLVATVPHALYHALNTEQYETKDQVGIIGGLVLAPVIAVVVLVAARGLNGDGANIAASTTTASSRSTT